MSRVLTAVFCGCLLLAVSANADVLLSNLPATGTGSGTNLGLGNDGADRTKGVSITMGATAYQFESMVALISNGSPASTLSGGIYADSAGIPGSLLAAFTPLAIAENAPAAEVAMTLPGAFTLEASTKYWFVLDGPTTANSLLWQSLTSGAAPTPAAGIAFNGYQWSSTGGAAWSASSTYNGVTINAVIPEPATLALLGLACLALRRR